MPGSIYYGFSSYGGGSCAPPPRWRNSLDWYIEEALRGHVTGTAGSYAFGSYGGHDLALRPGEVDIDADPRPFVHFVVKVASRCNIKCSYCYMYEHADQSWRTQPQFMSDAVEVATIDRI